MSEEVPSPAPHSAHPKNRRTQWWQKVARRIRVPMGFLTAALFLIAAAKRR